MKKLHTEEHLDEMRKRLYDRGIEASQIDRHELTDESIDVSRDWVTRKKNVTSEARIPSDNAANLQTGMGQATVAEDNTTYSDPPKRHYRHFILLGSLLIFVFVAVVSSLFLYFGGNQISSDNIKISVIGPSQIGGGEVVPLQVSVTNNNSVPMESATLILKYPLGTRSVGDSPRNLFEERIPLEDIAPDEVRSIPLSVAIFGEENAQKQIEATIEYRVNGSSGMFYKDANPLALRISSSPLVLRVESVEKVASGQTVDVIITAVSNASTPLADLLVTASYPNGFSYKSSNPEPVYGDNVWRIDKLMPEQSVVIKLQGVVTGLTEETFRINLDVGPSNPDNQFMVGASLADAKTDFVIERPFIDVAISINGDEDREVIVPQGEKSRVNIGITNTIDETVYDMVVEVVPGGNALTNTSIVSHEGFYDSNTGTVRWEVANNPSFGELLPGDRRSLTFEVNPGTNYTTASYDLVVNVYARRVAESSALETLIGTVRAEAKYSSTIKVASQAGRNTSVFTDTGPVPPKVGEVTTYTLTMRAEAGANDMANAVVETSLPLYVNWLNAYEGEGDLTYNSVSKSIQWVIGDISSGQHKEMSFQVSFLPSTSQLRSIPVLLNKQIMRANDRFTGELLQDDSEAVRTELSAEMGFLEDNGKVQ